MMKIKLFAMYLVLSCMVTIGQVRFDAVHSVQVKSSWKELTDTAEIEVPKNLKFKNKNVRDYIKTGDPVTIKLGYNENLKREFVGFVREIEGNLPIKVLCEDYSYILKRKNFNQSFQNATLKDVVSYISSEFDFATDVVDIQLGKFAMEQANGAKVLEQIRSSYGLVSYFKHNPDDDSKPVLHVGFPYAFDGTAQDVRFRVQSNILSHDLKYKSPEDNTVKIKAISNLRSGQKKVIEVGDEGGSVETRNYPELSEDELRKYANEELRKAKLEGYRGSITAFGIPRVEHGDTVILEDTEYPDRQGSYLVDATNQKFSEGGYRRDIEIGQKV
ncbi:MAG: hypothetical protein NW226_17495 [Microscillaceae bacterium]|nr:hypothetical protein [Microscillaceae bacterium]